MELHSPRNPSQPIISLVSTSKRIKLSDQQNPNIYPKTLTTLKTCSVQAQTNISYPVKANETEVFISVMWPAMERHKKLNKETSKIGMYLLLGSLKSVAKEVWSHQQLRKNLVEQMLSEVTKECRHMCREYEWNENKTEKIDKRSIMKKTSKSELRHFSAEKLDQEMQKRCPLFRSVLKTAAIRPYKNEKTDLHWLATISTASSIIFKNRSKRMTALQKLSSYTKLHKAVMASPVKKSKLENITKDDKEKLSFDGFDVINILMNDPKAKRVHVHGKFKDSEDEAIITLSKTAFSKESVEAILSNDTSLDETFRNDIYGQLSAVTKPSHNIITTQIIKPATEKHILKYTHQDLFLLNETAEDYKHKTLPYLEKQKFSINWVYNILEHKTESDRIIFEDPDKKTGFILLPDLKWDGKQIDDLYLSAITHCHIKSIRELNKSHLPLLRNILEKSLETIKTKYGVEHHQIRAYFHYYPSYYHLHVHLNHIHYDVGGTSVGKAHLLSDVIDNIENIDGEYYMKKTLPVTLRERDPLLAILMSKD